MNEKEFILDVSRFDTNDSAFSIVSLLERINYSRENISAMRRSVNTHVGCAVERMHAIDTSISVIYNSTKPIRALHVKAISANRFGRCDAEKKNYKASIASGCNDMRHTCDM